MSDQDSCEALASTALPTSPTDSGHCSADESIDSWSMTASEVSSGASCSSAITPSLSQPRSDSDYLEYIAPASSQELFGSSLSLTSPHHSGAKTCRSPQNSPSSPSSRNTGDRFLPKRQSNGVTDIFKVNKDPRKLTAYERLVRNKSSSIDVFTSSTLDLMSHGDIAAGGVVAHRGANSVPFNQASIFGDRQVSSGNVWAIGGLAPAVSGVPNGRGRLISSGSNAPLYTSTFSQLQPTVEQQREVHECRLATALELDRTRRVYDCISPISNAQKQRHPNVIPQTVWSGSQWISEGVSKILDAPNLRDDFYCSVLAYSPTCHLLAVALGPTLYAWSEAQGVQLLSGTTMNNTWITCVAFSSIQGCKSIVAFGRSDGLLTLLSIYDSGTPRFDARQPCPIACVSWKPTITIRQSQRPGAQRTLASTEDLLVGDESGHVYYYVVEWPSTWEAEQSGWPGSMTLVARISVHTQQICGMAWSFDGTTFATGGNDNICCLFETAIATVPPLDETDSNESIFYEPDGVRRTHVIPGRGRTNVLLSGAEKHRWIHGAAVKAIAFCPWKEGLVATGGGSNDRCIHFYHTASGACLATINVAAQVTSLIWSTNRREIAATFGYAQPEHPYRIAVFSWPDCKQVAAIPWEGEHRALYAIPYPHTTSDSGEFNDHAHDGCIVVAASDESVKFHEIWSPCDKASVGGRGLLGGSDILEGMEGFDKDGEIIR